MLLDNDTRVESPWSWNALASIQNKLILNLVDLQTSSVRRAVFCVDLSTYIAICICNIRDSVFLAEELPVAATRLDRSRDLDEIRVLRLNGVNVGVHVNP